jgi:hypothetical protein
MKCSLVDDRAHLYRDALKLDLFFECKHDKPSFVTMESYVAGQRPRRAYRLGILKSDHYPQIGSSNRIIGRQIDL